MTSETSVLVSKVVGGASDGQYTTLRSNELGHQLVADGMPPYAFSTYRGNRFKVRTATLFAPIVAMPSTLANLEVNNNKSGYIIIVDTIWSMQVLGTAVVWSHTPWAAVGLFEVYAANTALVSYSANGDDAVTSASGQELQLAITQTVVESGWETFPGNTMNFGLAAATPGGANIGEVAGRLVVPYGKSLYVAVTGSVATASSVQIGMSGHWAAVTNIT